ncbi:MAG: c-type cytochrome [Thiohalocapsa sp.]|uniref:c-type cytochrome n=1 Tax=Thiohalocapsa sp. TaxID=2497641 RepID=UPI0025DD3689|nr:c-type cytochrome [Thiohalocapsa sp.]MCG6943153.1 c-type cytochrome [Thiohalocapsa sp.]
MSKSHLFHPSLRQLFCTALILLPLAASGPVSAAGDAKQGARDFSAECADCHSVRQGKNKKGPSLFGVVGRAAGTMPKVRYSDSMRASNITWTPDRLDAYIAHPKGVVPKGRMKYDGLNDARARADIIAFLAQQK